MSRSLARGLLRFQLSWAGWLFTVGLLAAALVVWGVDAGSSALWIVIGVLAVAVLLAELLLRMILRRKGQDLGAIREQIIDGIAPRQRGSA